MNNNNRYIFKRTRKFALSVGLITLGFLLYIVFLCSVPQNQENYSDVRIAVHSLQNELELSDDFPIADFDYAVFDLQGRILFSTINKYQNDIDVRLLSTVREYTAPLIVDGVQTGILVASLPENQTLFSRTAFLRSVPAIVLCLILIILTVRHFRFIKKDIIRPLNELHGIVGKMVKGDLSVSVSYDYDGEMGTFCHDFEAMRDELRDAAEREHAHQEKERMLFASLSHDLKTPLASIYNYAESIRYGVVRKQVDIEKYTDIIIKKSLDLTRSIEDILTHVQTQMRQMNIKKEELYAKPFFEKLLSDISVDVTAKGLTLESHDDIPNILLHADPMRITQVFENIIGNSLKYTKSGGCITVSVNANKTELRFSLEDNGCGIRVEDVTFVFEPFFRGEKSRDPNVSGSGLGLSIAKYIVEQHGGKIACESVFGEGTKVVFSIGIE